MINLKIHDSINIFKARVGASDTTYLTFDLEVGPRPHYSATFDLALNQTLIPLAGYSFYSVEILDAVRLALTLDFEVTIPRGTKRHDFVIAKCAEFVSLGQNIPDLRIAITKQSLPSSQTVLIEIDIRVVDTDDGQTSNGHVC